MMSTSIQLNFAILEFIRLRVMAMTALFRLPPQVTQQFLLFFCHHATLLIQQGQQEATIVERLRLIAQEALQVISGDCNPNLARNRRRLVGLTPLPPGRKRRATIFNLERGILCVSSDYWGLQAKVSDYHFKQMFRITRGYTERIIQVCLRFKPSYFACGENAFGKRGIPTYMKVLAALKTVAFGVGAVCFTDYF
jgi:hypothetical protein